MTLLTLPQTREIYDDVDFAPRGSLARKLCERAGQRAQARGSAVGGDRVGGGCHTSRFTGLIRESILGALFGAGAVYDAYVLGFRIPSLARELFAEGALSSAFIPTFTRFLSTKSHEEARKLSNITATVLLAVTGAFCALGMVFSPLIVGLFAPGFHAVPGKFELAVSLVRTMFPFLLLLALSAQAQGIFYAYHSFGVPAVSPALFNIATVSSGLVLGYVIGPHIGLAPIRGMAFGDCVWRGRATRVSVARRLARGVWVAAARGICVTKGCGRFCG